MVEVHRAEDADNHMNFQTDISSWPWSDDKQEVHLKVKRYDNYNKNPWKNTNSHIPDAAA